VTGTPLRRTLEARDGFAVIAEFVPWRHGAGVARTARSLATARELAAHPRIAALNITDGAGGHAATAPIAIAEEFAGTARDLIINIACRGRSHDDLGQLVRALAARGLTNVLAISGDYPQLRGADAPPARFDLDSAGLLTMMSQLEGIAPLFPGGVVNTHKRHEREQMPQYHKLELKIRSGARFIVSQLGYDARKDDELLRYLRLRGVGTPCVTSVFILSAVAARKFNAGQVAGCVVTDDLLALVERQAASPDKGRAFFLELAARQVAIARGLGFRGALVGGHHDAGEMIRVLEIADGFARDDWRDFAREIQFGWPGGFHYFERDAATSLNRDEADAAYLASCTPDSRRGARDMLPTAYRVSRVAHDTIFAPTAPAFPLGELLYRRAERSRFARSLHVLEQAIKEPLFECRDCGDCSLAETGYLCPESQCPKGQRNGPCGGSRDGRCEVDDRACIWALAYDRLKPYGEEGAIAGRTATIADASLRDTSAWANTFLGRDHISRSGAS